MTRAFAAVLGVFFVSTGVACADFFAVSAAAPASAPIQAICQPWVESPCLVRVGASLRSERSGRPIAGKRLWFLSRGTVLCSGVTDDAGSTSCHGVAPSGRAFADVGYSVVFEGDGRYESTAIRAR